MIQLEEIFDFLAALMVLVAIWAQVGSYVISKIQVIVIQTSILSTYALLSGIYSVSYELIILAFLIIFLRGILTAVILLRKFPERSQLIRERSTTVPSIIILSIATIIITLIVYRLSLFPILTGITNETAVQENQPIIAIGFVLVIQGLLLIATRKNKVTQFTGYIEVENAMILLSLGIFPLPLIVEISVLLDVLALVIVASVLLSGNMTSERIEELVG
jgi:hydrogenase-4 component E